MTIILAVKALNPHFSRTRMERYGVSSTPTFVLINRAGKVARYLPVRLTEAELDKLLSGVSASSSR